MSTATKHSSTQVLDGKKLETVHLIQESQVFLGVTLHPLDVHHKGVELCNIERLDLRGGDKRESGLVVLTAV